MTADAAELKRFATLSREAELRVPTGTPAWLRQRVRSLALTAGGAVARALETPALRCFYLHFVYDDQPSRFREVLRKLQSVGRFLDGTELLKTVDGNQPVHEPCFHLSFDDAFDNNHRNAFPILEELGIKATFFVPSAMVGASDETIQRSWWAADAMSMPTRTMNWDQVRELADAGHEIGSHTRNHVRLSDISHDPQRLRSEVRGSKQDIEDRLGRQCRFFSWPYGTAADIDAASRDEIEAAGYDACFSAVRGVVRPGARSSMDIPRHHFEGGWPWLHVRYFALGRAD